MHLLIAFTYQVIVWHVPTLIPFSTINNISMSVNSSNFTSVFSKADYYVDPGSVRKRAGSNSYISRHIFRKFSNTLGNNTISLQASKSWYLPNILSQSISKLLLCVCNLHQLCLSYLGYYKSILFQVLIFHHFFFQSSRYLHG